MTDSNTPPTADEGKSLAANHVTEPLSADQTTAAEDFWDNCSNCNVPLTSENRSEEEQSFCLECFTNSCND